MSKRRRQKERDVNALIAAATGKDVDVFVARMQNAKDLNAVDSEGLSALMAAAANGRLPNVERLLAASANVNQAVLQTNGVWGEWTALSFAARFGYLPIVRILLESGALLDWKSDDGETPLMLAAFYGHKDVVELLLAAGASASMKNHTGEMAYDLAVKMGQLVIAQMLESEK